jgi:hypothetical protein
MTTNDAAAVLEYIVEKRGAEWVASNWGLDREQLARWYEGQEELPPEMVFAMRVWVSAVRKLRADAGCFEDADDHPPEVPEDVTETGWRAVPMSTVGRGEALWDVYRSGLANLSAKELNQMEEAAWAEAGKRHGVDALKEHGFLPDIMPITAWDIGGSWASIVDALADVVRSAIEEDDR